MPQSTTVDHIAAYATAAVTLTGHGEAASIPMAVVTPELFPLLGVAPIAGRVLAPSDDAHGAERTAVISETLWTRSFERDPSIIGKAALLDGDPIVIVGVMPARFEFPFDAENPSQIWMPVLASRFSAQWADQRGASFLKAIGRLRPASACRPRSPSCRRSPRGSMRPTHATGRTGSSCARSRTCWSRTTGRRSLPCSARSRPCS